MEILTLELRVCAQRNQARVMTTKQVNARGIDHYLRGVLVVEQYRQYEYELSGNADWAQWRKYATSRPNKYLLLR